jgi:hypothetical protein
MRAVHLRHRTRLLTAGVIAAGLLGSAPGLAGAGPASGAPRAPANAKRGVASARYLARDPARLARIGATWGYDWSATPPGVRGRVAWVPMAWGPGSVTPRVIASLIAARRAGRAAALLGFNEPDSAGQSNTTPARAAALWPELQRTGLRLGSPAPAVPSDGWLAEFMRLAHARHLRVDFIALHYYQDFTDPGSVTALRRQLVAIHQAYHRPIWITEIGALDIRRWHERMAHTPTPTLARAYMGRLFAMLDALRFVERYAWFTDNCWNDPACRASSLFDGAGRPTALASTFGAAR